MKRKLLIVGVLLCGVAVAAVWVQPSFPILRYRLFGDPESFDQAFATLKRGDTVAHVENVLRDTYFDAESAPSVREGFKGLVASYPERNSNGYRDSDTVYAYTTDGRGRYGIQFRDGRIIEFCYQQGAKMVPDPKTEE